MVSVNQFGRGEGVLRESAGYGTHRGWELGLFLFTHGRTA